MPGPTTCRFGPTFLSRGFDFTFAPGVTPSVCLLSTVPHVSDLPNVGQLVFQTLGEAPFTFRDCLLESPRLVAGDQGQFWQLPVLDRRWMWQFGYIHGSYNQPKPDGSLLREKTPQEIVTMLFEAMGETGADVSRLPNDARPQVNWQGAVPVVELDGLCSALGCVVTLDPFQDRAVIWPVGEGLSAPNGPTRGSAFAPVYPAQPKKVRVEAGPTLFQATFKCEPVGLDIDGRWKKIDDLSYAPTSLHKWGNTYPGVGFPHIPDTQTYVSQGRTLKTRDLADATVFRCYRIMGLAHGGWKVPFLEGTDLEPESLKDFQLFDELADEEISTADGALRRLPAVAYARYWRDNKKLPTAPIRYENGYSLDAQHGIVSFNEPLFLMFEGRPKAAEVRFECAFHAGKNGVFHRYHSELDTGSSFETKPRMVPRPEITLRLIYRYSSDSSFTFTSNVQDTVDRLNYWGNAALDEYGQRDGASVNYQKLMQIAPDGLAQQVTWSGGGGRPARTQVSWAQRHNRYVKPLEEYRDRLTVKRMEQQMQIMALQTAVRFIGGGLF